MVRASDEWLAVLLPEAREQERERARGITRFVQMLIGEARRARPPECTARGRAFEEYERSARERSREAWRSLMRTYLHASLPSWSAAWFGVPTIAHDEAWHELRDGGEARGTRPSLPTPGEAPWSIARRLLELAAGLGLDERERHLWELRALRVSAGPAELVAAAGTTLGVDAGERRSATKRGARRRRPGTRAYGETHGDARFDDALRVELLAGLLDQQRLFEVLDWVERWQAESAQGRLGALARWSRAAFGQERAGAGESSAATRERRVSGRGARGERTRGCASDPPSKAEAEAEAKTSGVGPVPTPLRDLFDPRRGTLRGAGGERVDGDDRIDAGTRGAPLGVAPFLSSTRPLRDRRQLGASVLVLVRWHAAGVARVLRSSLAPALSDRLDAWVRERDGAWMDEGTPERELLTEGRPVRMVFDGRDSRERARLDRDARAAILEPVVDEDGELLGWFHLEFGHAYLPARERLATEVALSRPELRRAGPAWPSRGGAQSSAVSRTHLASERALGAPGAIRVVDAPASRALFESLADGLDVRSRERRWWGFIARGTELVRVAQGGRGFGAVPPGGGGRALELARVTGGAVIRDRADAETSYHEKARTSATLVCRVDREVLGLFVLESERAGDVRARELRRLEQALDEQSFALRSARFRDWHRERWGWSPVFPETRAFAAFVGRMIAFANAAGGVVLYGEPSSGRRTLARWLHFEGGRIDEPLRVLPWHRWRSLREEESAVWVGEPEVDPRDQDEFLARYRAARARGARWIVVSSQPLSAARIGIEVAGELGRLRLYVPDLRDRRTELTALVDSMLDRFAHEEGRIAPRLQEDAYAALWRQEWAGGLRELESAVQPLTLLHPGESIDAEQLERSLAGVGVVLRAKFPSRHPRKRDLDAALRLTRLGSGRVNKRKAAALLGWDPDTLLTRLREIGWQAWGDADGPVPLHDVWERPDPRTTEENGVDPK